MFRFIFAATALLLVLPASAQEVDGVSSEIARTGLAATEVRLAGLAAPTPDEILALGSVRFLRVIERTQQFRWTKGMTGTSGMLLPLPILRLPVPENPDAGDFDPDSITQLFVSLLGDLAKAQKTLDSIADSDDVALSLDLTEIWLDINGNNTRDRGEDLLDTVAGLVPFDTTQDIPVIRFDTADAAWASAYAHLLSAASELVLAFDPAPQVARVLAARETFQDLGAPSPFGTFSSTGDTDIVDLFGMVYFSLQSQPDPQRTAAARDHLLRLVDENRTFWHRVEAETDNQKEWIPNDRQSSALAIEFPQGLGAGWQAILGDFEAMLNGDKLIPHWRLRQGAGLNLKRMFDDPVPVDLAEWLHGAGLLRYAEEGERINPESVAAFSRMVAGNALFYAIILN